MKMRICYPKTEFNNANTDIFLFNKTINSSLNHVVTRQKLKDKENEYSVVLSEVDENFLIICEKMQMMNFRQIYSIDYTLYSIGDITIKIGSIYREALQKVLFFEIVNPYGQNNESTYPFSIDVMKNIFPYASDNDLSMACFYDKELIKSHPYLSQKNAKHNELLQLSVEPLSEYPEDDEVKNKLLFEKQKPMISRYRKYIIFLGIIIFIIFGLFIIDKMTQVTIIGTNEQIKKPLTDNREYEVIRLNNLIEITLIADNKTTRSGMSMTVGVGLSTDPQKYPGLVKLTQGIIMNHNQLSDAFNEALNKGNGTGSYYINEDDSNYYFDIESSEFHDALKAFVQLFPLKNFNENSLKEKMPIILNEYSTMISEDYINSHLLYNIIEGKDQEKFDSSPNQTELITEINHIIKSYYTGDNIKIALISNLSIDKMKKLSKEIFIQFPNYPSIKNNSLTVANNVLQLEEFIIYKTKTNQRKLTLTFFTGKHNSKGLTELEYFVYMLQGTCPGSLHYDLFRRNFIENLNITTKKSSKYSNQLVISMILQDEGYNSIETVIVKTLNYFEAIIKQRDHSSATYNDLKAIYEKKFAYTTIDKYSSYLGKITQNMFDYNNKDNIKDLFYGQYDLPEYNETTINELYTILQPSSVVISVETNTFLPLNSSFYNYIIDHVNSMGEIKTIEEMNIEYAKGRMDTEALKGFMRNCFHYNDNHFFRSKAKNIFLTQLNHTIEMNGTDEERAIEQIGFTPIKFIDKDNAQLYYRLDRTFKVPRIHSYFHLLFPEVRTSNQTYYRMKEMLINHIMTKIDLNFDEARFCGNDIEMSLDENGINIKIVAYKDVYYSILCRLFDHIFTLNSMSGFNEIDYISKRFRSIKEKSLMYLGYALKKDAYVKIDDKGLILENDFADFCTKTIANLYIRGLLYGVVSQELRNKVASLIQGRLGNTSPTSLLQNFQENSMTNVFNHLKSHQEFFGSVIIRLNEVYYYTEPYYQITFFRITKRSRTEDILSSLILRKWNMLFSCDGIVLEKVYKDNWIYFRLMVYSKVDRPEILDTRLNDYIHRFKEYLLKMTDDDFKQEQDWYNRQVTKNDLRLRDKALKAWYEIYENTFDFNRYDEIIKKIYELKQADLFNFFLTIFIQSPRRITFQYYSPIMNIDFSLNPEPYSLNKYVTTQIYKDFKITRNNA